MMRVAALAGTAINTLVALLDHKTPPAVRLAAVRTVAELALRQHETETVVARWVELERAVARLPRSPTRR